MSLRPGERHKCITVHRVTTDGQKVWKVSTSSEIKPQSLPLKVRETVAWRAYPIRARTGISRLPGSTKVAKESPICRPINSPRGTHRRKGELHGNPAQYRIRICCIASHKAAQKSGVSFAGSDGAITRVIIIPNPSFTRFGNSALIGEWALLKSAPVRAAKARNRCSQYSHCSLASCGIIVLFIR